MNKLDRYIAGHVLLLTVITALALMAIHTFIAFVTDVDEVGVGEFGFVQLMQYIALQMPTGLLTLLPIIAMLGTLLGLGVLASQGELIAMRAAGVSLLRIGGATLCAGVVLAMVTVALADWIAPSSRQAAESLRAHAKFGAEPGVTGHPVWLRDGNQVFNIRSLRAEDTIADVSIYTLAPDLRVEAITRVDQGRYENGHWLFEGVRRTTLDGIGAEGERLAQMQWEGGVSPEVLRLFVLEARSLTTPGLLQLISYLEANGLDAQPHRLTLWRKFVAPFTVMVMMLLAIPFVLGPLRDTGAGQRLLVGVLIGLGFWVLNEIAANTGQIYRWPVWLSASGPTLLLLGIATWRLARFR